MKHTDGFRRRLIAFAVVVALVFGVFIARLFYLQVVQRQTHAEEASVLLGGSAQADNNTIVHE